MMRKLNIGIDIDNVISNFNEVLTKEFLKHDKNLRNTGIVNKNVHMVKGMFDWSNKEIGDFYNANIERIAKSLDLINGAKEYIDRLKQDGHFVYIITGRNNGEYKDPYNMTLQWLKEKQIAYDKLILTNAYENNINGKTHKCKEYSIDVMIDDSVNICQDLIANNINTLLMDTPFNRDADMPRVYNWQQIYEYINNLSEEKINVILDTDTYNECDDQFALSYMLKNQELFNIQAITIAPYISSRVKMTIAEGQENSYNEVLKICKWLNFDTNNKVYKGATGYMKDGYYKESDAVNKIIEVALKNKKTYIIAIGAITNVALAIKKQPSIIEKIEIVWLGGHSLFYSNNIETNFKDVEAVKTIFESDVNLTIIPAIGVASNLRTSIYELNHYLKGKSELCDYLISRFYNDGYHGIQERRVIWDISAIAYMINRKWFSEVKISCPNINDDTSYEVTTNNRKITMVNNIDVDKVYKDLFEKLTK